MSGRRRCRAVQLVRDTERDGLEIQVCAGEDLVPAADRLAGL